jgi:Uncharacterized MobA-related protein
MPADVAALVLAAGRGSRFGREGKLLQPFRGRPLVCAAVDAALTSRARPVVVVGGDQRGALDAALTGLPVRIVANPEPDLGLSSSLRVGLRALPEGIGGAVVLLGDMPLVTEAHIDRLFDAFAAGGGEAVCVPTYEGRRGNPVLWPAVLFVRLVAIEGDRGGRAILGQLAEAAIDVAMPDDGVLIDVDDPASLVSAERLAVARGTA